jgi:hypothetical protein
MEMLIKGDHRVRSSGNHGFQIRMFVAFSFKGCTYTFHVVIVAFDGRNELGLYTLLGYRRLFM